MHSKGLLFGSLKGSFEGSFEVLGYKGPCTQVVYVRIHGTLGFGSPTVALYSRNPTPSPFLDQQAQQLPKQRRGNRLRVLDGLRFRATKY